MTAPSEMVELAAKAAYSKMNSDKTRPFRHCSWEELKPESREAWRESIVTAIEAMREPTEAMIDAAKGSYVEAFAAMIDAAIKEPPT